MTAVTRRLLVLAVLLVLLSSPVWFLASDLSKSSAELAEDWVSGLSQSELDRAASKIDELSPSYRDVVLARLSPARRAEVWRQNLLSFVASNPDLSREQMEHLQRIAEQLTPDLFELAVPFDAKDVQERRARIISASRETIAFLSPDQYRSIFYTPGPMREPEMPPPSMRQRVVLYFQREFVVHAQPTTCECHDHNPGSYDDCPSSGHCVLTDWCDDTWFGCGQWDWETCEGMCC